MAEAAKARSLDEKRFIQKLETDTVPYNQKQLKEIVGSDVALNVVFDSFNLEGLKNLNAGLQGIRAGIRGAAHDAIGKEHVQQHVKKVNVTNISDASKKKNTLKDGVLDIQAAFEKGIKGFPDEKDITKVINAAQ